MKYPASGSGSKRAITERQTWSLGRVTTRFHSGRTSLYTSCAISSTQCLKNLRRSVRLSFVSWYRSKASSKSCLSGSRASWYVPASAMRT